MRKILALAALLSTTALANAEELPWDVIHKTDSEITSGSLQLSVSTEEFRDTRPIEVVMAEAEADANKIKKGMSGMQPVNGQSQEQWDKRISDLMQGVRDHALARTKSGSVSTYEVTLLFSDENFKLIPEEKILQEGTGINHKGIVYYHDHVMIEYFPGDKKIIIYKDTKGFRGKWEPVQVDEWLKPGRRLEEADKAWGKSGVTRAVSARYDKSTVQFSASSKSDTGKMVTQAYTLSPQLGYVILSGRLDNPGLYVETTYEHYSSGPPHTPAAIAITFFHGDWAETQMKSTATKAEWNPEVPDATFIPDGFPLVTVQDDRFTPSLSYLAEGQLPSDEDVAIFREYPEALAEHNRQFSALDH